MKSGKIKNDKVVNIVSGAIPEGNIQILKQWELPTEYPVEFYLKGSSEPIISIVGSEIHENLTFVLKGIEQIKDVIYDAQKKERFVRQIGSFPFDGGTITLKDRSDARNIALLSNTIGNYKSGRNKWIKTGKIVLLKAVTQAHVQAAFDWEMSENEIVDAFITFDELKTYFDSM